jgi:hypothetical protein
MWMKIEHMILSFSTLDYDNYLFNEGILKT